jgi:hypothetical protein
MGLLYLLVLNFASNYIASSLVSFEDNFASFIIQHAVNARFFLSTTQHPHCLVLIDFLKKEVV